jgi:hypothetical protein
LRRESHNRATADGPALAKSPCGRAPAQEIGARIRQWRIERGLSVD